MANSEIFSSNEIPQGRRHSTLLQNNFTTDFSSSTSSSFQFAPPSISQNGGSSSSQPLKILIVGSGVAGPLLAVFLAQSQLPLDVTVLERTPGLRTTGQQIDIRGPGLKVLEQCHPELLEEIRRNTTNEAGLNFVDKYNRVRASWPVKKESEGETGSFSSEIEILRGSLVRVIVEASKSEAKKGGKTNVKYVFDDHVSDLIPPASSASGKVGVTLASGTKGDYDLVVAADGMRSSIRKLAFKDLEQPIKSLGQYTAFFTIPYKKDDGTFAAWYNAPLGRCILLRPDNAGATRAYLSIMASDSNRKALENHHDLSVDEQKRMMRALFEGAGWETKRVLNGMDDSDDYYMQEIAQVKVPSWSSCDGRVVLLGDAGYCPSPISGMGTTLAVVGAYVLAGELVESLNSHLLNSTVISKAKLSSATTKYEYKLRPIVKDAQAIFPGAPGIANPMSAWGIEVLLRVLGTLSWIMGSWVPRFVGWVGGWFKGKQVKKWDDRLERYNLSGGKGVVNGNVNGSF